MRFCEVKWVRRIVIFFLLFVFAISTAYCDSLRYGMKGDEVAQLQNALIKQGYLKGSADGVYGPNTEKAVRNFQNENGLFVDGVAGNKTQSVLYSVKDSDNGFFSGDYSNIEPTSDISRIKLLQKALIRMKYLNGSADGIYGTMTDAAVRYFQYEHGLKEDGIAGRRTLAAMEKAVASGYIFRSPLERAEPLSENEGKMKAPDKASIQLLSWFDEIAPGLKNNATFTIYEPVSGLAWKLKIHSKGRHLDAEPLTVKDTQIMMKAFGNKNTWTQKGVYVLLPDGRWTVGATHSVPHLNWYIRDNGFDGVICVHFFRDMEECSKVDPSYGVSNQYTIRALWKKVSGEDVY